MMIFFGRPLRTSLILPMLLLAARGLRRIRQRLRKW